MSQQLSEWSIAQIIKTVYIFNTNKLLSHFVN